MFNYDVLCVGSATVDHFLTTETALASIKLGDKVLVKSKEIHSGGGATNTAATLAKLGLKVKILTKLGDDHDADFIKKEMKKYKVKNICLHTSKKPTNTSIIVSSSVEKDRIIYAQKGASRNLNVRDFKKPNCNWIYMASLVGKSFSVLKELTKYNKKIAFNPSLYLAKKGKRHLKPILEKTNVLILNKEEAQTLLNSKASWKTLLHSLNKLGPETVVITNGHKPFYSLHQDKIYKIVPPNVPRISTAGAGDCFAASVVAGIIKKLPFAETLKLAQANASSLIQKVGTKEGLCSMPEVRKKMKKYKTNVTISN